MKPKCFFLIEPFAKRFEVGFLIVLFSLLSCNMLCAELSENVFPSPGIRAFRNGQWVGSDHLFNVSPNIDVVVEVVKAEGGTLPVAEGAVRERVVTKLEEKGITPHAKYAQNSPPLPFFHVLLMVSPAKDGYLFYCSGRLFEQVKLDRVILPEQIVFQAITWEKQSLDFASTEKLKEEIETCVDEIVEDFIERFKFYEGLKRRK